MKLSSISEMRFALLVTFACVALACNRQDTEPKQASTVAAPAAPTLNWKLAQPVAYRLELKGSSAALDAQSRIAFALTGQLQVASREVNGASQLAVRVTNAKFDAEGESAQQQFDPMARELESTYVISLRDGVTQEEHLPKAASRFASTIFRSIGSALQMGPGTPSPDGSWETEEFDGSGKYQIEYRPATPLQAGLFERKKLSYSPTVLASSNPGLGKQSLRPQIVESKGKARVTAGRLDEVSSVEEISVALLKGLVSARSELWLVREPAPPSWSVDWAKALADSVSVAPGVDFSHEVSTKAVDAQRIGDYTFDSALKELTEGALEGEQARLAKSVDAHAPSQLRARAFSAMIAILRSQPEHHASARSVILKAGPVASSLTDALASAWTPETQAVLVGLLDAKEPTRHTAAGSLVRVQSPSEASEAAVRGLCADAKYLEYCLYGLGTYARKLRESGSSERAARIGSELSERLRKAKGPMETQLVLRGVGNSGDGAVFAVVSPLLSHESGVLRSAAVDAIRLMPGGAIDQALSERLKQDSSTGVRLSALSAAGVRDRNDLLEGAVTSAALNDANSGVRRQALKVLTKWLPERPQLKDVLSKVAANDQNEAVKSAAKAALGGRAAP